MFEINVGFREKHIVSIFILSCNDPEKSCEDTACIFSWELCFFVLYIFITNYKTFSKHYLLVFFAQTTIETDNINPPLFEKSRFYCISTWKSENNIQTKQLKLQNILWSNLYYNSNNDKTLLDFFSCEVIQCEVSIMFEQPNIFPINLEEISSVKLST